MWPVTGPLHASNEKNYIVCPGAQAIPTKEFIPSHPIEGWTQIGFWHGLDREAIFQSVSPQFGHIFWILFCPSATLFDCFRESFLKWSEHIQRLLPSCCWRHASWPVPLCHLPTNGGIGMIPKHRYHWQRPNIQMDSPPGRLGVWGCLGGGSCARHNFLSFSKKKDT